MTPSYLMNIVNLETYTGTVSDDTAYPMALACFSRQLCSHGFAAWPKPSADSCPSGWALRHSRQGHLPPLCLTCQPCWWLPLPWPVAWLSSAHQLGAMTSTSSCSTLSSSPGGSCQSGSSCFRRLPGAVTAWGNASQVLQLNTNSTVFVQSMQKAFFADFLFQMLSFVWIAFQNTLIS